MSLDSTTIKVHQAASSKKNIAGLKPVIIQADGSYDSVALREEIKTLGAQACIKPRRNRKLHIIFDKEQYKERHLVECFFQKLKLNQRIWECGKISVKKTNREVRRANVPRK